MEIINTIHSRLDLLTNSQKKIASYIIKYTENVAFLTAAELSENCGVSEATVVRFAKAINYNSYAEMQKDIQSNVRKTPLSSFIDRLELSKSDDKKNESGSFEKVIKTDVSNLLHTLSFNDEKELNQIVNLIADKKTIYIVGSRASEPMASYLSYYLNFIRSNVKTISLNTTLYDQLLDISSSDLLIAISLPRYSMRTLNVIKHFNDSNVDVVGITDSRTSPVAQLCQNVLIAEGESNSFFMNFVSVISLINVILTELTTNLKDAKTRLETLEEYLDKEQIYAQKKLKKKL